MKEMTSNHDDLEKRLAIFAGLGGLLFSTLVGLIQGYTLEAFLLQGVVVLVLFTLVAYAFGTWLRDALKKSEPAEELADNVERRRTNAEDLEMGSVVMPGEMHEAVIAEDPASPSGQVVNYTLPELSPMDGPGASAPPELDEELAPPPVPSWLK
jgi:membrane protein implicated in regulation of membrane protease activity